MDGLGRRDEVVLDDVRVRRDRGCDLERDAVARIERYCKVEAPEPE